MKKSALSVHERVRLEAFLLSERAGHPSGMDHTFWVQAEEIVHGRTAVVAGAGKAAPKRKVGSTTKSKLAKKKVIVNKPVVSKRETTVKAAPSAKEKSKSVAKRAR